VTGLLKTLTENRVFNHLRNLRLVEKLLVQGLILTIVLIIIQVQLDNARQYFMSYMPPIGFALLMFIPFNVHHIPGSTDNDRRIKHLHNQHALQNQRLASWVLAKRHISAAHVLNNQPRSTNVAEFTLCIHSDN
jgi:hypothetical protein